MFNKFKEDTTEILHIEDLLKGHINGKVIKHEIQPLTTFGENFGSEILRVEITVEENGEQKILHAVAKLIPPTEMQLEVFNTQVTYKNETQFYEGIVPLLQNIQREHRFSTIAEYFPKLYGARYTLKPNSTKVDTDAVILLENLKIEGYTNIERLEGFDLVTTKQILRDLANLQATVIALKIQKPDEFSSKVRPYLTEFKAPVFPDQGGKDPLLVQFEPILKENPNTGDLIPRLSKFLARQKLKIKKIREPWATIVHNDLWVNNIMVKHTNDDIQIKLVDFQVIDYGSPIMDMIFFLLSSVQTSVLRYHLNKLILFHYNELIQTLKQLKVDVKDFTYESYQEELKLEAPTQVWHTLWMINVVMGPKGIPKMPGKVPEWNPNGQSNNLANGNSRAPHHAGPPGGPEGPGGNGGPPPMQLPSEGKEKVHFVFEEAAKRNWI